MSTDQTVMSKRAGGESFWQKEARLKDWGPLGASGREQRWRQVKPGGPGVPGLQEGV